MPYLKRSIPIPEPMDCRIMTAALCLFVREGYHNVSIHEIQKQAQVSIGSIYNHFGGKEGVAKALYQHILHEIDELVDNILHSNTTPAQQCQTIIEQLFNHTETHRDIIAFAFHAKHAEFISEEPLPHNSIAFIKIRQIIEAGIQQGEFRPIDPFVISAAVFGTAIRMIQLRLDGALEYPLPHYLPDVLESIWVGVKV